MKVYEGLRTAKGPEVTVMVVGDKRIARRPLNPRFDLWNHSPTGFEWGYAGSGPAQLALAICADYLGDDERAVSIHQQFKAKLIQNFDADVFTLTETTVREAIDEIEREAARRSAVP